MVKDFSQADQKHSDGLLGGLLYRSAYGIRPIGYADLWGDSRRESDRMPSFSSTKSNDRPDARRPKARGRRRTNEVRWTGLTRGKGNPAYGGTDEYFSSA